MNTLEENLRLIAERVKNLSHTMATEEAVKTAVVLPFLRALGYDVFDPTEIVPEFTADAVGKKGEKVDYVVKIDNEIRILIECKAVNVDLEKKHLDQLYRYFSVTNAKFAILTNGRNFNFYTDLDAPNKLDSLPFLIFDICEFNSGIAAELRKFEKSAFDIPLILATAERLKYTSAIKKNIGLLMEDPPKEFIKIVSSGVYDGIITASAKEMLSSVVKSAFREIIMDQVQSRISTALAETKAPEDSATHSGENTEPDIVTTEDEIEGYLISKSIVRDVINPKRVVIRDQKSYCAVLIDDNNRKPLVRLWFNKANKYLGLFDGEAEEKIRISSLDDIYLYADRMRDTARKYCE